MVNMPQHEEETRDGRSTKQKEKWKVVYIYILHTY